jgi:hypothetical protein
MRKVRHVALAASATALILVPSALAQEPTGRVYGGQGGDVQDEVTGGAAGGLLPFTGLDLMVMVVAAVLLIGAGLAMRRLARDRA